jgi:HK97 gp10 family phage protein
MAKFNVVGFDEIEKEILKETKKAEKAVPLMLQAGAEILIKAQKTEIDIMIRDGKARNDKSNSRSWGDLKNSITATNIKNSGAEAFLDIHPQGVDRKGVRNAEKGFILEYGTKSKKAYPWMTIANEKSEEEVHKKMLEVWGEVDDE